MRSPTKLAFAGLPAGTAARDRSSREASARIVADVVSAGIRGINLLTICQSAPCQASTPKPP